MALSLQTSDLAETSDQEMLASTGIARLCMVLDSSADGRPGGSRSLKKHYRYHPDHSAKEGQEMSKKRKLRTMSDEEMENVDHSEWLYRDLHHGTQAADPEQSAFSASGATCSTCSGASLTAGTTTTLLA